MEQKPHSVKWSIVWLVKQSGGLGMRDSSTLNEAPLGKWFWRFASKRNSLWKQVIVCKYGQVEGGWCAKEAHSVGLLRNAI